MAFFFTTPNKTNMPSAEYRVKLWPVTHNEKSANGTAKGSDSRIVNGCVRLSNSEARIIYMNTTDKLNAMRNSVNVRSSSRPRPVMTVEYPAGIFRSRAASDSAWFRSASPYPGEIDACKV